MSDRLNSYINFISRIQVIIILCIAYIISQSIIAIIVSPLGLDMMRVQTTISAETFRNIIEYWERSNLMVIYLKHFYLDYFHLVIYSFTLSALLSRGIIMKRLSGKINFLVLIPFFAGFMDLIENSMHIFLINNPLKINATTVMFSGICTNIKWVLAFLCLFVAAYLFTSAILQNRKT